MVQGEGLGAVGREKKTPAVITAIITYNVLQNISTDMSLAS